MPSGYTHNLTFFTRANWECFRPFAHHHRSDPGRHMNDYALGKDIQQILDRLARVESKVDELAGAPSGVATGRRTALVEHAPKFKDSEIPIESPRSDDTLALYWGRPFDAIFGTFGGARLEIRKEADNSDAPLKRSYFGCVNRSIGPVLFTIEFVVEDSAGNVLDIGDGTHFTWVPALSVPSGQRVGTDGPYSFSRWAAAFIRHWDRIARIRGTRTVTLDPNGW